MRNILSLSKLLPVLPADVREALASESPASLFVWRKAASVDAEDLQEGERAAIRYVSTRDKDRDDEIMLPSGAVLDQFRLAPQVLWGHNYSEPPIGSDEWIRADDYGLKAKTVYATTPRAEEVWTLVKEGHLKTSSVGFAPLESLRAEDSDWKPLISKLGEKWNVNARYFSSVSRIHTKWLLLEHSDVSVPANIHALTQAVAKGLTLSDEFLHELGIDTEHEDPLPQANAKAVIIRKIGQVIPYGIRPINIEEIVQEELLRQRGKV
jgi:HK97 family phage prohead protease